MELISSCWQQLPLEAEPSCRLRVLRFFFFTVLISVCYFFGSCLVKQSYKILFQLHFIKGPSLCESTIFAEGHDT